MNLLNKILNKVKELLSKFKRNNNIKLIEEKYDIKQDFEFETSEEKYPAKDYFLMYKNIKKGLISIDNLMLDDLIKIMAIADEEISILDEKLAKDEKELLEMQKEVEILIKETNSLKNECV